MLTLAMSGSMYSRPSPWRDGLGSDLIGGSNAVSLGPSGETTYAQAVVPSLEVDGIQEVLNPGKRARGRYSPPGLRSDNHTLIILTSYRCLLVMSPR